MSPETSINHPERHLYVIWLLCCPCVHVGADQDVLTCLGTAAYPPVNARKESSRQFVISYQAYNTHKSALQGILQICFSLSHGQLASSAHLTNTQHTHADDVTHILECLQRNGLSLQRKCERLITVKQPCLRDRQANIQTNLDSIVHLQA